jgi:hypothetical protein
MEQTLCWICDEVVHDEEQERCDSCSQTTHAGCLSEEGEDGRLCAECIDECPGCEMPIVLDWKVSEHFEMQGIHYVCPFDTGCPKTIYSE